MTRDAILSAIRAVARRLGRAPTRAEFTRLSGISHFKLLAHFPSLREAVRQAGFEPNPQGLRISSPALLGDWAQVTRKLGCLPSRGQYLRHGRYSAGVFTLRFGSWTSVPRSFARFVRQGSLEDEWKDVLRLMEGGHVEDDRRRDAAPPRLSHDPLATQAPTLDNLVRLGTRRGGATSLPCAPLPPPLAGQRCITHLVLAMIVNTLDPQERPLGHAALSQGLPLPNYQLTQLPTSSRSLLRDRPVLGPPLWLPGLAHEPVNETGVVFLFGMLAHRLGFQVEHLHAGFPDCEAKRQLQPGKWQRVRIEFEFESRNFLTHRHPAAECDVIVCWRDNWPECPNGLEVVELRRAVTQLQLPRAAQIDGTRS